MNKVSIACIFLKLIYATQFGKLCLGKQIFTSNPNLSVHCSNKLMEMVWRLTGQSHCITVED